MAEAQNNAYSMAFIWMHLIEIYFSRIKKVLSVTANQIVFNLSFDNIGSFVQRNL